MAFPTTGILDSFTDTDGVDLPAHDGNWSTLAGTTAVEIQGNAATGTTALNGIYRNDITPLDSEVYFTVTTRPADGEYIIGIVRFNPGNYNGYLITLTAAVGTDTILLQRSDLGVPTILLTVNQEIVAGDSFGLSVVGSTLQMYYKASGGSWAALGSPQTDATYSGAGSIGMTTSSTAVRVDDFGGGELVLPPVISVQPTDQTVPEGTPANFTTTVTGAASFQWEQNDGAGAGWVNASGGSGETADDLTTPVPVRATHSGRLYRLNAINPGGTTTSNIVLLRVTAIPATYSGDGFVIGQSNVGEGMVGAENVAAGGAVLAAGGTSVDTGTAALTTAIQAAAAGLTVSTGSAALTAAIQLALAGQSVATGTADLSTGAAPFSAAGAALASGSAAITTGIALGAIGASLASGNGLITTQIVLTAAGIAQAIGSAALSSGIRLAAGGQAAAAGSAGLTTQIAMAAIGAALASGSAGITAQIQLNGGGFAVAVGAADLTASGSGAALAAAGQAAAAGTAGMDTQIRLAGSGAALGTGSGALSTAIRLAATGQASATGGAGLATGIALQAIGVTAGNGNGTLTASITLTAAGWAEAIAAGGLTTVIQLSAAGVAQAAGAGSLAGYVFVPTPRERTVRLDAESRVLRFPIERRVHRLPIEDRIYQKAANG